MKHGFFARPLPVLPLVLAAFLGLPIVGSQALTPAPGRPGPVMKVGDAWAFDSGLTITFLEVVSDTRRYAGPAAPRPRPVKGAGARPLRKVRGNAGILLRLEAGNQEPKIVRINTLADPTYVVIPENEFPDGIAGIPKSYSISIRKLLPEASKRGGLRAQSAYRLRLSVLVAL